MTTTIEDVVAAITAEDGTSWQVADAVADLPEVDEQGKLTLQRIADDIYKRVGVEWSPAVLGKYRATARAFAIGARVPMVSFRAHEILRAHPDKLRNWKPLHPGDVLTVERAAALRGRSGVGVKPDAWRASLDRAVRAIRGVAENDPAFVIETLERTITTLRQDHRKALEKAGSRALRVV